MDEYDVEGVAIKHCASRAAQAGKPPLLFVHGGCHASWCWEKYLEFFSQRGWDGYALDWFNHGTSRSLPMAEFVTRHVASVTTELGIVANALGRAPILIGHSMGGLASQAFAARSPVAGLVLLAPGLPAAAEPSAVQLPPFDHTVPWDPPPFEVAKFLFYQTMNEDEARPYIARLQSESPQAVADVTSAPVDVDLAAIDAPALLLAAGADPLCPATEVETLARLLHGEYRFFPDIGHCDLLLREAAWQTVAEFISGWLDRTYR